MASKNCEQRHQFKLQHRQIFEMMKEKQRGDFYQTNTLSECFSCKYLVDS